MAPPPKRRDLAPTLREVARLAGVHPGTASRALREDTRDQVNEETVARVTEAAAMLNYRPNPIARGLKTNRSNTIGVVVPDIQNPLFPPILRGIGDELDTAGYSALITNTDNDPERERGNFEMLLERHVDGFITATARREHALLAEVAGRGRPIVLANRFTDDHSFSAVTVDERDGTRLLVEHLADLGHSRIAYVAGPQAVSSGYERYLAFREAIEERGLAPDEDLIAFADAFTEQEGRRCCGELLRRRVPFTAIVAANDLAAIGCYVALADADLRCPDDVSVVGFNDMPFADRLRPALTTIRVPQYEIGARAARLLLDALGNGKSPARHELMPASLVVRASTAPPTVR